MNPLKHSLHAVAKAIFYLALFAIGSKLYFFYAEQSLPAVNSNNLPADFAVFATWRDGATTHCQVFHSREIPILKETHPAATLNIPNPEDCIQAIRHFESNEGRWPVQFEWQPVSHWPHITHSFEKQSDDSLVVELSYRRDDDDYNKSRYQLREGKISAAWQMAAYGPGLAMVAAVYGLALAFAGFIARVIYAIISRRTESAPPGSSQT